MRYFVTGATGFIGGRVARQLIEQGHQVVTVARTPEKAGDLTAIGVEVHKGDITDKESLRAPMQGADGVFHLAGWYKVGVKDKTPGYQINVVGTRNVLEMMRELAIPKGVYTSTLAINSDTHGRAVDETYHFNGTHLSEYDKTKWQAHYEVADPMIKEGLPLVIVQPGLVYGIGDTSSVRDNLLQYLQGKLPLLPQQTAFAWGHVDDIAAAHIAAMEKGKVGESYIIAGPIHTFIEAIQIAEKITGIPGPTFHAPPIMLSFSSVLMSLVELIFPVPEAYSAESLRITAGVTYIGTNAKAKRELGYKPRPLEEGLRETLLHEMNLLGMKPKR